MQLNDNKKYDTSIISLNFINCDNRIFFIYKCRKYSSIKSLPHYFLLKIIGY